MNDLVIASIEGKAVGIRGNDIDTDQIVPARFLKDTTFDKMGEYLFYDARFKDGDPIQGHPLNQTQYDQSSIMIVGNNFGCGSSREHAPQAIKRAGFKAIVGVSFAEIFSGNCKALGIVTLTLPLEVIKQLFDYVEAFPEHHFNVDLAKERLKIQGFSRDLKVTMKPSHKRAFLNGTWDELSLLNSTQEHAKGVAKKLPYFNW